MKFITFKVSILFLLILSTPVFADNKLQTVKSVDMEKYMGKWFEIARIDNQFQRGCYNTTAEYSYRPDGDIRVENSCDLFGKVNRKVAIGRAWASDKVSKAKLKVQFFLKDVKIGLFAGDYWIIDLAEDYSHVIVGEPRLEYFWILSRTASMDDELLNTLVKKAESFGYDSSLFIFNKNLLNVTVD